MFEETPQGQTSHCLSMRAVLFLAPACLETLLSADAAAAQVSRMNERVSHLLTRSLTQVQASFRLQAELTILLFFFNGCLRAASYSTFIQTVGNWWMSSSSVMLKGPTAAKDEKLRKQMKPRVSLSKTERSGSINGRKGLNCQKK